MILLDQRISAIPERDGWWTGPDVHPGQDYAISLDDGPPRPDPRSPWQPHGVHGPTRAFDPRSLGDAAASFRPVPLRDAVIYELHIGTFSEPGNFASATKHLDHLVALGVTHVEIMPVAQWSGRWGWGYDGVDLFAPHAPYGGPAGLHNFIQACHDKQLAVIIDVVHNHLGPDGAYASEFGPYKTAKHRTPWGDAINLDGEGAHEVRRFLIDSALQWLRDYGADGLRLDALHSLRDDSEHHFVAQLVDEVHTLERALGRSLVLIGEYDDHDPRAVVPRERGGWGLAAHWNDDFHHAVHALLTHEHSGYYRDFAEPGTLARILRDGYALDGRISEFRGGPHGRPFGDLDRDRLVAYIQSHDQVGNRAAGERLQHLVGTDKAKIAAAILLTSPFVPMLFQGEEWAASTPFCFFVDFESEDLRRAVREGRRNEHAAHGWRGDAPDPTDPATREASVLRWDELAAPAHADMLRWYRDLIDLRRASFDLRNPAPGSTRVEMFPGGLQIDRGPFALRINLSDLPMAAATGTCWLASKPYAEGEPLPPWSCALTEHR